MDPIHLLAGPLLPPHFSSHRCGGSGFNRRRQLRSVRGSSSTLREGAVRPSSGRQGAAVSQGATLIIDRPTSTAPGRLSRYRPGSPPAPVRSAPRRAHQLRRRPLPITRVQGGRSRRGNVLACHFIRDDEGKYAAVNLVHKSRRSATPPAQKSVASRPTYSALHRSGSRQSGRPPLEASGSACDARGTCADRPFASAPRASSGCPAARVVAHVERPGGSVTFTAYAEKSLGGAVNRMLVVPLYTLACLPCSRGIIQSMLGRPASFFHRAGRAEDEDRAR